MGSQYSFVEALVQAACSLLETLLTHGGSTSPTMETFLGASTVSWAPKAVNMSAISSWPYLKWVGIIVLPHLSLTDWHSTWLPVWVESCSCNPAHWHLLLSPTESWQFLVCHNRQHREVVWSICGYHGYHRDFMDILSPGIIFLVDILSHIESDQDFFNIASHGGIIEVQRHVLFSPACWMCWSVRGCQRSVHHPGDVATIRAVLPVYYSPSLLCLLHWTTLTKIDRKQKEFWHIVHYGKYNREWVFFIYIDHLAACCVAPVKYVRQRIFSTTPDTCSPQTTEDLLSAKKYFQNNHTSTFPHTARYQVLRFYCGESTLVMQLDGNISLTR